MSITQFLHILWARRLLVIVAPVFCLIGAIIVIMIVPPRYSATARVMVDLIHPDAVTGEALSNTGSRAYIPTQIALIKDVTTASDAVQRLGWETEPVFIQLYARRSKNDFRDFRTWLAKRIVDSTTVVPVDMSSSILEITYTGNSPREAQAVVESLRQAYLDRSVSGRRAEAQRNADWFQRQAEQAQRMLIVAGNAKSAFERESGIVLTGDQVDLDTARLSALAGQAAGAGAAAIAPTSALPSVSQLAQMDADIAQARKSLGPNHPSMQAMEARRAALAQSIAREEADARRMSTAAGAAGGALDRALQTQKARVIGQRDKVERLRLLQNEVELRREQVKDATARAAQYQRESAAADAGLSPLGPAIAPPTPTYPKKPLILGGALALGLAIGLLSALLLELLMRRVRSAEDMKLATAAPVLGIIPGSDRMLRIPDLRSRLQDDHNSGGQLAEA
jgi:succinoglycan biosynthesis transport protein ExoP